MMHRKPPEVGVNPIIILQMMVVNIIIKNRIYIWGIPEIRADSLIHVLIHIHQKYIQHLILKGQLVLRGQINHKIRATKEKKAALRDCLVFST